VERVFDIQGLEKMSFISFCSGPMSDFKFVYVVLYLGTSLLELDDLGAWRALPSCACGQIEPL
jgi:hypothetical protein